MNSFHNLSLSKSSDESFKKIINSDLNDNIIQENQELEIKILKKIISIMDKNINCLVDLEESLTNEVEDEVIDCLSNVSFSFDVCQRALGNLVKKKNTMQTLGTEKDQIKDIPQPITKKKSVSFLL